MSTLPPISNEIVGYSPRKDWTIREFDKWPTKHWDFLIKRKYSYYDTPDGQDLQKKLWYLTTTFGKAGVVHGIVSCIRLPPFPKTYTESALRVVEYTKPWLFIPYIFACTTHFGVVLREKDDVLNYAVGGFLAGTYMGNWYKCVETGIYSGIMFCTLASIMKYSHVRGYSLLGSYTPINFKVQTVESLRGSDHTRVPEYPRNWLRAEEVAEKKLELPQGKLEALVQRPL